jgi:hypothetical protein
LGGFVFVTEAITKELSKGGQRAVVVLSADPRAQEGTPCGDSRDTNAIQQWLGLASKIDPGKLF